MNPGIVGGFLVVHGVITAMIGLGTVTNPTGPAMTLPGWLPWWPGPLGRSWLIDGLGLGSGASMAGGAIWLVAGVALLAGGLGWLGVAGVRDVWQPLLIVGGLVGLVAIGLYFHPLYLLAVAIDVVVVVLAWGRLTAAT
ncbi:MAG TPA: hypothetical protein VFK54_04045 [Candidatus Limnocylindrales bacterium]|nr:hypothetical protein [Candidatus Limnocylindrales bacterium]